MITDDVFASLKLFCDSIINEVDPAVQYFDWDAHAAIQETPKQDVLGPMGLSFTADGDDNGVLDDIAFSIAVSCYGDDNLFRHRRLIGTIFHHLRPAKTIRLIDGETGMIKGKIVVTGPTMISPVTRAETRPLQFVHASGSLLLSA